MKKFLVLILSAVSVISHAYASLDCNSQYVKDVVANDYHNRLIKRIQNSSGGFQSFSGTLVRDKKEFIQQVSLMDFKLKRISELDRNNNVVICAANIITTYEDQSGGLSIQYKLEKYLDDDPKDEPSIFTADFGTDDTYLLLRAIRGKGLSRGSLPSEDRMSKLFTNEMLYKTTSEFESVSGSPLKTLANNMKVYHIEGCDLQVVYDDNRVSALSVNINNKCSFIYAPSQYSTPRLTSDITFGNYGSYAIDCLDNCSVGHGYVYEYIEGAGINDYKYEVYKKKIDNHSFNKLRENLSMNNLIWDAKFNQDFDYSNLIELDMKNSKIDNITIGLGYSSQEVSDLVRGY